METEQSPDVLVYAIGSQVLLDDVLSARITAIQINSNGLVSYQCVWWDERNRKSEWVEGWEIKPDDEKTRQSRVSQLL